MLDYQKMILQKVSFDRTLFEKEMRKTISLVSSGELNELREWAFMQFGNNYSDILRRCFAVSRIIA